MNLSIQVSGSANQDVIPFFTQVHFIILSHNDNFSPIIKP
jgi:hypothetical protein